MPKPWALAVWRALVMIGVVNFLVFVLVALMIGGDAVNGHRTAGHFYLESHGKVTEVSESVWLYSRAHVYSVWITHPLAMIAGMMLVRERRRGKVAVGRKWV